MMNRERLQIEKKERTSLAILLAGALLLRLVLLAMTQGYHYDINCFFAWALRMAETGPGNFYSPDYFADYPPGYMLVLWVVGNVLNLLHLSYTEPAANMILGLVPSLADCGLVYLIWRIARQSGVESHVAFRLATFVAACPVLWFDTGVWKQVDSVEVLPLLLCFYLLEQERYLPAAFCFGLALAVKPQALLLGPVLAICFLLPLLKKETRLPALKNGVFGILLAIAPAVLCGLPFFGRNLAAGLIEKYLGTAQSYPYASINAFNWMAFLGGNWVDQNETLLVFTWEQWGTVAIAALTIGAAVSAFIAWRKGRFSPLLLAGVYEVGIFTFAHNMHERYLILGAILVLGAAAKYRDARLTLTGAALTGTSFLNLVAVYWVCQTDDEWLTSATSVLFMRLVGLAETICFLLLLYAAAKILQGSPSPINIPAGQPEPPAERPKWSKKEIGFLCGLTLLVAVVSFAYLGELTAPQTVYDTTVPAAEQSSVTVTVEGTPAKMWIYRGIQPGGRWQMYEPDGTLLMDVELKPGDCFSWEERTLTTDENTFTITVQNGRILEMAFFDAEGNLLPINDPTGSALFDEQELVPESISQLNSFYFDEIYHARTGYEERNRMPVYETTHPPLGKDFIMLGIFLFGMTGFGWRCFGALFGVLMVPVMYLLARRLTGKPWLAALAAALLSCDFMRFSQSRIATIDVYATFFILLGAYFMVCYCQSVLEKGVTRSILPMALCGIAFGLGCASKWTGIYAGAGLAVVYFWVLYARWKQKKTDFRRELTAALLGGVVFFVLVPLGIYLLSYLPYVWRDPNFGLRDWWNCQVSMYEYHSNLNATHPFQSAWYTWLLDLRPVWYYQGKGLAEGMKSSIAGFYNPVVAWCGLAALLVLAGKALVRGSKRKWNVIFIFFLSQLLPWMLVSRCTFLYHAFPSMMFALLAIVLEVDDLDGRSPVLARRIGIGLVAAAAVLFVWFYPVLSGLPVPEAWARSLMLLPSWGFYIF